MHGHDLLLELLKKTKDLKGKVLIEVGTTRESIDGQDSSYLFAKFCNENGLDFTTVDMDSENTLSIIERCYDDNLEINAVTEKGEEFLKKYEGKINFLYLDAFDFDHPHHSGKRKDKYRDILNETINNESCYNMHLDCCINSIDNINVGGYICIDDVLNDRDYRYKGKKAVPYLLNNGFRKVRYEPGCILLQKVA